jgi:choline dehydrogenase-like flavoprotein
MITDANDVESAGPALVRADICIIGSGAVGIAIAREFIGTPHAVVVLEGGGLNFEQSSQEPYQSEVVGLPHGGVHAGRVRVTGGTTTLWAGQALPLFEMDFQQREWVPYSGWPITRSDLLPYYRRAESVMQIPHVSYQRSSWPKQHAETPEYEGGNVVSYFSQFTRTPNFWAKYRDQINRASNVTVLTHANAVALQATENSAAIRHVVAKSFDGRTMQVVAQWFIVCCGGIENARLLLASDSVEAAGIGNRHDVLGRFFQDHPGVGFPVRPRNPTRFGQLYNSFYSGGIRHAVKLVSSEFLQRQQRILHTGAEVYYPSGNEDAIGAAKQIMRCFRNPRQLPQLPGALARVARQPRKVAAAAFRHYVRRQPATVGSGTPYLGIGGEQEPNPQSRITLSKQEDQFGMRRTVLNWRLTDSQTRSIEVFLKAIAQEWDRLDLADIDESAIQLRGREHGEHGGFVDANHHIGTTRMGTNPRESVVDSECRVHGYDNLYIGGSSVFPTSGFSNPTLTAIALGLRLADKINGLSSHRSGICATERLTDSTALPMAP